jgi:hypothetical protein
VFGLKPDSFHKPAELDERPIPHHGVPRLLVFAGKPTVLQLESTVAWRSQKVNFNDGAKTTACVIPLPEIYHPIGFAQKTGAMDTLLPLASRKQINPKPIEGSLFGVTLDPIHFG